MNGTLVLARNTFREAIRDRLLYTVLVFGALILAGSVVLAPLTLGEEAKVLTDLGLGAISLFSVLVVILVGTGLVYKEIERRTIYTILAHPVRRHEFLVGKYLGLCGTLFVGVGLLGLLYVLVVVVYTGGLRPGLFAAVGLTLLEAAIVTAVALFFSTVSSPLLSAVFTFSVWGLGHLSGDLRDLTAQMGNAATQAVAKTMYVILPSLHHFDVRNNLLAGEPVAREQLLYCGLYTVLYVAALLLLTAVAFARRDFE